MTLAELWELFPIDLEPHNPDWKDWADGEISFLLGLLSSFSPRIHHIGSTAIPEIKAKPIIDILVEIPVDKYWAEVKALMEANGYICMSESERRISFNKGYTPEGYAERVYHIHCCRTGDNDEILFRDYMLAHTDAAKAYDALKASLLPKYRTDRDGYTAAKSGFIKSIIAKAEDND